MDHKLCEETVKDTVGNWCGDLDCDAFPPNTELYMKHTVPRVFHVLADEFGNFRCHTRSLDKCQEFLHSACK